MLAGDCLSEPVYLVMSTPPITVKVGDRLWDAARVMYEARVGSVLVVDDDGRLVGIITSSDILRLLATGVAARNPLVGDVMTINVVTARGDETLEAVETRMREVGVRHIPIVDEGGRPIGIVTQTDILRRLLECTTTSRVGEIHAGENKS